MDPQRIAAYASRPQAEVALFGIAALEGMLLPFPADFLLIPMVMLTPDKAFRYALIATAGSVCGALVGYLAGFTLFQLIGLNFFGRNHLLPAFLFLKGLFTDYTGILVISAGFSPIPYKIITLLSGFFEASLPQFIMASIVSRGARFFLISWLLWRSGARYQQFLQRHFYSLSMALTLGFLLIFVLFIFLLRSA
jgi:membrane protein YqaA with SNARE-associated domain